MLLLLLTWSGVLLLKPSSHLERFPENEKKKTFHTIISSQHLKYSAPTVLYLDITLTCEVWDLTFRLLVSEWSWSKLCEVSAILSGIGLTDLALGRLKLSLHHFNTLCFRLLLKFFLVLNKLTNSNNFQFTRPLITP